MNNTSIVDGTAEQGIDNPLQFAKIYSHDRHITPFLPKLTADIALPAMDKIREI
jgi:hypothetical protein